MLERFLIFTKGGLILYEQGEGILSGDPITRLIQTVLLEVRGKGEKEVENKREGVVRGRRGREGEVERRLTENTCPNLKMLTKKGRGGDSSFSHGKYMMEWLLLNEHDLILAVRYSSCSFFILYPSNAHFGLLLFENSIFFSSDLPPADFRCSIMSGRV